jgi:glycosyltransferase involved in cell wall biosynthesis
MKVAFLHQPICTISPTNLNSSVEIITYEMAHHLAKNCDVIVYARRGRHEKEFEYYQGVQYRRVSTFADEKLDNIASGIEKRLLRFYNFRRPVFASQLYYLTYALRVARDLRSEKCDVVHIHNFSQFVPIIRALNPKIKIVLHMHCDWLTELDRAMIENRLRETDLVLGVSNYISERIRRKFPQFSNRCRTLYNGVDVSTFKNSSHGSALKKNGFKQLLFVGRVSPEKGVHVLLEAFETVLKQHPQVQLKLVGQLFQLPLALLVSLSRDPKETDLKRFYGCNYLSYLQAHISRDEACCVSFAGAVPHRLLANFYRDADVCVVPSVCNEPCGMPILESMATGVPVIATIGGGTSELIIDGETGLLVERDDASALAEAILRLLSDEELRKSMGKNARKRAVELYSWEVIVENLLNQYRKICNRTD